MSKNHRGKGILDKYKRGRGTCPTCKRTGVKIIHEQEIDKQKIFVCKICNVVISRKEMQLKKKAETMTQAEQKSAEVKTPDVTVEEKEERMATETGEEPGTAAKTTEDE